MELTLLRTRLLPDCTTGRLFETDAGSGGFCCDTLEPPDRGLSSTMEAGEILKRKAAGRTAIPAGRYRVLITKSPRFGRWLPLLLGVKGFSGVRIHVGNTANDTSGCILVGQAVEGHPGFIGNSRQTLQGLMRLMTAAQQRGEQLWLTVKNVYARTAAASACCLCP